MMNVVFAVADSMILGCVGWWWRAGTSPQHGFSIATNILLRGRDLLECGCGCDDGVSALTVTDGRLEVGVGVGG